MEVSQESMALCAAPPDDRLADAADWLAGLPEPRRGQWARAEAARMGFGLSCPVPAVGAARRYALGSVSDEAAGASARWWLAGLGRLPVRTLLGVELRRVWEQSGRGGVERVAGLPPKQGDAVFGVLARSVAGTWPRPSPARLRDFVEAVARLPAVTDPAAASAAGWAWCDLVFTPAPRRAPRDPDDAVRLARRAGVARDPQDVADALGRLAWAPPHTLNHPRRGDWRAP